MKQASRRLQRTTRCTQLMSAHEAAGPDAQGWTTRTGEMARICPTVAFTSTPLSRNRCVTCHTHIAHMAPAVRAAH